MKYMIIGAGGIGGAIAAYLSAGGKDVTIIARGEHLRAIQANGLTSHTSRRGEITAKNIKAYSAEDDFGKADVIFVCVKGYSLTEIFPVIEKAAHSQTVVIPILNTLSAGKRIRAALPQVTALDGCIYGSSFVTEAGVITQPTPMFRIVFGAKPGLPTDTALLERIAAELEESGVDCTVSDNIERDTFKKFIFISAFASTDSYFDVALGELKKPGEARDMFLSLLGELKKLADAKGIEMDTDIVADSIKMLDGFDPAVTSSMHKDIAAGKSFEKQELIFDVVEMAREFNLDMPEYAKAAAHFGYGK